MRTWNFKGTQEQLRLISFTEMEMQFGKWKIVPIQGKSRAWRAGAHPFPHHHGDLMPLASASLQLSANHLFLSSACALTSARSQLLLIHNSCLLTISAYTQPLGMCFQLLFWILTDPLTYFQFECPRRRSYPDQFISIVLVEVEPQYQASAKALLFAKNQFGWFKGKKIYGKDIGFSERGSENEQKQREAEKPESQPNHTSKLAESRHYCHH